MKQNIPKLTLSAVCDCLYAYIDISPEELNTLLTAQVDHQSIDEGINDRLLTLKEVQSILGVSHRHLYNLKDRGEIQFHYIGHAVRIKESDVKALIGEA